MDESDEGLPEGVAIVRQSFERWADEDLTGTLELFDEECEIKSVLSLIEGGVYRGHEGIRRWFTDVYSDWTAFRPELHAFRDTEESLLVAGRIRACARHSSVELDSAMWWRYRFRDGRILTLHAFLEPTDAHRAAGLVGS